MAAEERRITMVLQIGAQAKPAKVLEASDIKKCQMLAVKIEAGKAREAFNVAFAASKAADVVRDDAIKSVEELSAALRLAAVHVKRVALQPITLQRAAAALEAVASSLPPPPAPAASDVEQFALAMAEAALEERGQDDPSRPESNGAHAWLATAVFKGI